VIVVDASVTLAWSLADEQDAYAERVLELVATERGAAPAHWPLEVANGLLVAERRGRITMQELSRIGLMLGELPVEIAPIELSTALRTVTDAAREHGLSAYDAGYLDLAWSRNLPLATLDGSLKKACLNAGIQLVD
jgi:predicted nucleic acid-binding protein